MIIRVNPKISEWLSKQPWRFKFIDNLINKNCSPDRILCILIGSNNKSTISGSFSWYRTPEGHNYWDNINDEFVRIYTEENWKKFEKLISL